MCASWITYGRCSTPSGLLLDSVGHLNRALYRLWIMRLDAELTGGVLEASSCGRAAHIGCGAQ